MEQIFISYSRQDTTFVDKLVQELEKRGYDAWMDREDIRGGATWREAISSAIRACNTFIIVLSESSTLSDNVAKELALADKHKRTIIPICFQGCEIPPKMEYQLAGLQIIDFSEQTFEKGLQQLLVALPEVDADFPIESSLESVEIQQSTKRGFAHPFLVDKSKRKWVILAGVVGSLIVGVILWNLLSPLIFKWDGELSGTYNIQGNTQDCRDYAGTATISKSGRIYMVQGKTWWVDGTPRSEGGGIGTLEGNTFTITWALGYGETRYRVQRDGSLSVMWDGSADPCIPGEEFTPK